MNYFKSIVATAALIVGSWNPAPAQTITLRNSELYCSNDPVFAIIKDVSGNFLGFHKNGNVAFRYAGTRLNTYGTWQHVPGTDDVDVTLNGNTVTIEGLWAQDCKL